MQVLWNGLYVLKEYGGSLLLFLMAMFGAGVWLTRLLPDLDSNNPVLQMPASLCIGAIPLAMLSFTVMCLARLWPVALTIGIPLITGLAIFGMILWVMTARARELWAHANVLIPGGILFLLVLIVRLSFLRGLLLPPSFDSAVHVEIVQDFLSPQSLPQALYSLPNILHRYYHFGFHSLAAWFVLSTGTKPQFAVSLLGQLFLVLAPISIFYLAIVTTNNIPAAIAAACLACVGWKLPAFAANWGKYPALSGITILPSVLGMLVQGWKSRRKKWSIVLLLLCLVVGETLFHSRTLICLGLAVPGFALAGEIVKRIRISPWRSLLLAVFFAALFWTQLNDLLKTYADTNYLILAIVLILSPFAFRFFPRPALAILLYICGIVLLLKLPLPIYSQSYNLAWLDLPFLAIMTYIPLALLGGLGLAGFLLCLKQPWLRILIIACFFILVLGNSIATQSFSPDPFYNFVRPADVVAITWIDNNTTQDASVIISGAIISSDSEYLDYLAGSDAGIWVEALTRRKTIQKPFNLDWSSPQVQSEFCQLANVYVYSGGWPFGFNPHDLKKLDWMTPVEDIQPVVIFRIKNCQRNDNTPLVK
ncbi:MAG: hypothetical protein ABSA01_15475 [Anaerolineales bacterium]|jgi:hypothetical protein